MRRRNPLKHSFWTLLQNLEIAIAGIFFFVLSFYTFEWNETQLDLAHLVRQSIDITNVQNPTSGDNRLISITARIEANPVPSDAGFLTAGRYIAIDRLTEEYKRNGDSQDPQPSTTNNNQTRSSTPNSTARDNPRSRTQNPNSTDRDNPRSRTQSPNSAARDNRQTRSPGNNSPADRSRNLGDWRKQGNQLYTISSARVGRYHLDLLQFTYVTNPLSSCQKRDKSFKFDIPLHNIALTLPLSGYLDPVFGTPLPPNPDGKDWRFDLQRYPNYIFAGLGYPDSPWIGDTRTCYAVLPTDALVTVFGSIDQQSRLIPHRDRDRDRPVLRLVPGSRAEAIDILSNQYHEARWLSRFAGFVWMWWGLFFLGVLISILNDRRPPRNFDNPSFYYYFWPAFGLSIVNASTTFFSHSIIPALPISCALILLVALVNWRWL
jgi:Transmembrane protein 43